MKRVLLGIDLQYDFCNLGGALFVKGADSDVVRINHFIKEHTDKIDSIILSMDSHQPVHIAHQIYWKDKAGNHPDLYTNISSEDVKSGKWIPQYNQNIALDYLMKLESGGDVCTIWPPHCIIGSKGWSVDAVLFDAIEQWTLETGKSYDMINKGMYQATEHYSIFKAAVEYSTVPATLFNNELYEKLSQFDQILIAGEAADFCVANSLSDLLAKDANIGKKVYMLENCMSYIIPENKKAVDIFDYAKQCGVTFSNSTDIFD